MKDTVFGSGGGNGEIYYTVQEVCALLQISKPTLWRRDKSRALIPFRDGRLVRYRKSVVDKYVADHEGRDRSK